MKLLLRGLAFSALACLIPLTSVVGQEQEDDVRITELSPFAVVAEDSEGYYAAATLSGTRLRTPLSDIGAAVSVVTKDFMDDVGATGVNELLLYTAGTEAGGLGGNISGGTFAGGFLNEDDARRNPQSSNRVRGLISADLTRGFAPTDIPFDSYNVERVDINRGANALLFGLGSPSGVIDNTLIKPIMARNATNVVLRVGKHDSHRGSLDHNQMIIEDRVAVRAALLYDHTRWQQWPTFKRDQRVFVTGKAVLFKSDQAETTFSANYEHGEINHRRPMLAAPRDFMSSWWLTGQPSMGMGFVPFNAGPTWPPEDAPEHITNLYDNPRPSLTSSRYFLQYALRFQENATAPHLTAQGARPPALAFPGFPPPEAIWIMSPPTIGAFSSQLNHQSLPVEIFDFRKTLLSGTTDRNFSRFNATNLTLEQNLFNYRLGFELTYDRQHYVDDFWAPFGQSRSDTVQIDAMRFTTDGRHNPDFGRPYIVTWESGLRRGSIRRDLKRATAYAVFDANDYWDGRLARIIGRHTFTGLYSQQSVKRRDTNSRYGWLGQDVAFNLNETSVVAQPRNIPMLIYLGPSLYGVPYQDVRMAPRVTTQLPGVGESFDIIHFDRPTQSFRNGTFTITEGVQSATYRDETIDSFAAILQSNWLDDHIVTVLGWREDTSNQDFAENLPRFDSGDLQGSIDLSRIVLEPQEKVSGSIFTYSFVAKQPRNWELPLGAKFSVHYSESENFQPVSGQINIFGDEIAPPTGTTTERGFSVSLLENRVNLRVNKYKTSLTNSREGSGVSSGNFSLTLNQDFQTLGWWYDAVNFGEPRVTMDDIRAVENSIPQSVKDMVGYRIVTDASGNPIPDYTFPTDRLRDVANFVSEGYEFELVANITSNWRLAANATKMWAFRSSTAPFLTQYVQQRTPTWLGPLGDIPRIPLQSDGLWRESAAFQTINPTAALRINDGRTSDELREWRFNIVTNYNFTGETVPFLKGVGVGGAYRWQDKVVLGFPTTFDADDIAILDVDNPFYGDEQDALDVWVSYRRPLFEGRIDWKIQLNVRNLFPDRNPIVQTLHPNGTPAQFRANAPRDVFLTSTFSF